MALFGGNKEIIVTSPVDGKIKPLKKVNDEVFAGEMVGIGLAVTPTSSTVKSPIQGSIATAFHTGHAYGIKSSKGPEILVHIGVDTVSLEGEGFDAKVAANDSVKNQADLAEIDLGIIKKKAKSTDVIVLFTNHGDCKYKMEDLASGEVKAGDPIFKLVKA
jgi:glucose-specific phosphotransferase system IIA component